MNLDDAANVGEILGGLAILVTLIFGIRQIKEYNKAKEKEAGREVGGLLASPIYQYGLAVLINKVGDDFELKDMESLDRNQKDAINFVTLNTNSIGMMTFVGQLDFNTVKLFFQPISMILGKRFRRLVDVLQENAKVQGIDNAELVFFDWAIWLLDRMDELPPITSPAYELHSDWKP